MHSTPSVSEDVRERLRKIETVMGEDPGNRGIGSLVDVARGGLLNASLQLRSAQSVGIVTGFFILGCSAPETDGPLGALAIARALTGLNKRVTIITDEWCGKVMKAAYDSVYPAEEYSSFVVYPNEESDASNWAKGIIRKYEFDHLLSIERVGPAADGKCYNMRGIDITPYTAPLHTLFQEAERQNIHTTGIGDGGNEIGMGKVVELVKQHVPHGDKIGCSRATDNLLVTGVSNWGGYALATSIYALERQVNNLASELLPTREKESDLLDVIVEAGAVDGPLKIPARSVDGIPFDKYIDQLERMTAIASAEYS